MCIFTSRASCCYLLLFFIPSAPIQIPQCLRGLKGGEGERRERGVFSKKAKKRESFLDNSRISLSNQKKGGFFS